jgi:hypothetical protein
MKNNSNKSSVRRIIFSILAIMVTGSYAMAQPKPETKGNVELRDAHERLGTLMASTEQALQYVAPDGMFDDIQSAWDRLDLLAEKTEAEIRYTVPDETRSAEPLYLADNNPPQMLNGIISTIILK